MKTTTNCLTAVLLLATVVRVAGSQSIETRSPLWVGAPLDEYVRLLQLAGEVPLSSRMLRPLGAPDWTLRLSDSAAPSRNPWRARYSSGHAADTNRLRIQVYDPIVRMTHNSAVPFGTNDGAMWAGRGLATAVDAGAAIRYGPISIRLAPTFTYSQNASFTLGALHQRFVNGVAQANSVPADMSPFADPYMSFYVDQPQRFGEESLRSFGWGQSAIKVQRFGLEVTAGTESMWWGPGQDNAILMTNNAGGIPHVSVGTSRPARVGIGKLEMLYAVGTLRASNYWRQTAPDSLRNRWLNGLSFVFEPRGAPGLYLGAARAFYAGRPASGIPLGELFEIFQPFTKVAFQSDTNPSGNDRRDQMISFMFRWVLPASNFEVYGELGRNDHPVDNRDLILEPDHATGFVAGLQKLFPLESGFVRVRAEVTDLSGGLTRLVRPQPTWYAHYVVTPGYTQDGQVIGAGVGPGGQSRTFRIDRLGTWGSFGAVLDWRRLNSDAYFREHVGQFQRHYHDVFLGAGAAGTWITSAGTFTAELLRQREYNRYGIRRSDLLNYHLQVSSEFRLF
jgi:hypothetical protein